MKKLAFAIVVFLLFPCFFAYADTTVYDNDKNLKYRIRDNQVYDADGNKVGYLRGSKVYDLNKNPLYRIKGSHLYDDAGNAVGIKREVSPHTPGQRGK